MNNDYPAAFLDSCIRRFMDERHTNNKTTPVSEPSPSRRFIVVRLPYLGSISYQVSRELREFLDRCVPQSVRLRFIHTTNQVRNSFVVKDRQCTQRRSNVVYKLVCTCGATYIGQTRRNLATRLHEHKTSEKSEVCRHLLEHPDHSVEFDNPEIMGSAENIVKLRLLESLAIQEHSPELNVDSTSTPLYLFNT